MDEVTPPSSTSLVPLHPVAAPTARQRTPTLILGGAGASPVQVRAPERRLCFTRAITTDAHSITVPLRRGVRHVAWSEIQALLPSGRLVLSATDRRGRPRRLQLGLEDLEYSDRGALVQLIVTRAGIQPPRSTAIILWERLRRPQHVLPAGPGPCRGSQ